MEHIEVNFDRWGFAYPPTCYSKGAYIYPEGEVAQNIFKILQGRVKLTSEGSRRQRILTLQILNPPDLFGVLDFFQKPNLRRCAAIAADEQVMVQRISLHEFEEKVLKNAYNRNVILLAFIERHNIIWNKYLHLQASNMEQMVFDTLESLALERGTKVEGKSAIAGMTHQDLADYIGISRQSVTSTLNILRRDQKIVYDRHNIILRPGSQSG